MLGSRTSRTAIAVSSAVLAVPLLLVGTTSATPSPGQLGGPARPSPGGAGGGDSYFPLYGNGGYSVRHYRLRLRYSPRTDRLVGVAHIDARAGKRLSSFNLDLVGMNIRSVAVQGRRARWSRSRHHELTIRPRRALPAGRTFSARIRYGGVPRPFRLPGFDPAGFLTTGDGATTIGQPEVAAQWFPVNDHPGDKATYRLRLTAPRHLDTVSNGLPSTTNVHGRWATTTWVARDPMASYLVTASFGRYDVRRRTANGLPIIDAVDSRIDGALRRRIDSSLRKQGEMLRAETRWFGPYPFETAGALVDRIRVSFAMENQTRPIYVPAFWQATTAPTLGDDVVVHELAHQWYGDSVALRRWRDIWLNEGFATYAEWLWNQRELGFTPQNFFDNYYARPADANFWNLRIGNPGSQRIFDLPIYIRGAMTLHALRARIGDDDFFRVLRRWAQGRRNGHGTTPQLIRLAERVSGRRSLDRLFDTWLLRGSKPRRPQTRPAAGSSSADAATAADVRRWERGLRIRLEHAHGR
jgi:aminopeptidase N